MLPRSNAPQRHLKISGCCDLASKMLKWEDRQAAATAALIPKFMAHPHDVEVQLNVFGLVPIDAVLLQANGDVPQLGQALLQPTNLGLPSGPGGIRRRLPIQQLILKVTCFSPVIRVSLSTTFNANSRRCLSNCPGIFQKAEMYLRMPCKLLDWAASELQ